MGILRTQLRSEHMTGRRESRGLPQGVPRTSALGVTKVQPGREGGGQGEGRGKKEQR